MNETQLSHSSARGFLPAFVTLNAMAGTSVGLAKVATSLYALELKPTAVELSLISGAQGFGTILMSIPLGILVDRLGPLKLFATASFLAGGFYMAAPFLVKPLLLALVLVLVSMSLPGRFVSMNAIFMQQLQNVGAAKAGWLRGSHMIGFFLLGPGIAVALIEALHFRGAYAMVGVSFFVSAAIAPLVMRHYQPGPSHAHRKLSWKELGKQFKMMGFDSELRRVCLFEFFNQATSQFYVFYIVVIALTQFGFSRASAASLVTMQGTTYVIALFTLGHLFVRMGERRFYLIGFATLIAALLTLGSTHSPRGLWIGGASLGLALGMLQTVNISRFATVGARIGRGSISGVLAFVGPLGGFAGTVTGGLIGKVIGLQHFFLLISPIFIFFAFHQSFRYVQSMRKVVAVMATGK